MPVILLASAGNPEGLFYAVLALNALFAAGVWCVVKPNVRSLVALVGCALVWPFVNGPLEGHILWTIAPQRGITVSDVVSVLALVVATVNVRELRSKRKRGD